MPKLSDKKVEELLIDYLKNGPMPFEGLMRLSIPHDSLDVLQGERVLGQLQKRGLVEADKAWYRLIEK